MDMPFEQENYLVGQFLHEAHDMGGDEDGLALHALLVDEFFEADERDGVKPGSWFVEDDDGAIVHEGEHEIDFLTGATGEVTKAFVEEVLQPEIFD